MAGKERAELTRQSETRNGRTAIIEAAEALFAEYGLHGASFRQISEAAKHTHAPSDVRLPTSYGTSTSTSNSI